MWQKHAYDAVGMASPQHVNPTIQTHENVLWHILVGYVLEFMVFFLEDGGSMVLWNTGTEPAHYTVQQPRKPQILSSPPWKPHTYT